MGNLHTPTPPPPAPPGYEAVDIDAPALRFKIGILIEAMQKGGIKNRERSLAITKLQEAYMWLDEENRQN